MDKEQYDWKTSQKAFEVFKKIYQNGILKKGEITVNSIAGELNRDKSVVGRQVNAFKKQGLIIEKRKGKYKLLTIDFETLIKTASGKNITWTKEAPRAVGFCLDISTNFENFENMIHKLKQLLNELTTLHKMLNKPL